MIRGTTQELKFKTDIDLTDTRVRVVFKQKRSFNECSLVKDGNDLKVDKESVTCILSQEDTFKFQEGELMMQIKCIYADGTAMASKIMTTVVERSLDEEVMTWE